MGDVLGLVKFGKNQASVSLGGSTGWGPQAFVWAGSVPTKSAEVGGSEVTSRHANSACVYQPAGARTKQSHCPISAPAGIVAPCNLADSHDSSEAVELD